MTIILSSVSYMKQYEAITGNLTSRRSTTTRLKSCMRWRTSREGVQILGSYSYGNHIYLYFLRIYIFHICIGKS